MSAALRTPAASISAAVQSAMAAMDVRRRRRPSARVRADRAPAPQIPDGQTSAPAAPRPCDRAPAPCRKTPPATRDRDRARRCAAKVSMPSTRSRIAHALCEARSAWARSSMMSLAASMPIASRTSSSPSPAALSCVGVHLLVGRAGGMDHQGLGVADIGEMAREPQASMNLLPAARPPLMPQLMIAPAPLRQQLLGEREIRMVFERGVQHPLYCVARLQKASTAAVFSMWRCMRTASVSMPCSR